MKLIKAQVTNFRSIEDSEPFEIGDMTCLVGKNEAGKTALLKALQGLHPTDNFAYDRTRDYPRRYLSKFDERHPKGESEVVTTWWKLDESDIQSVNEVLGKDALTGMEIQVTGYLGRKGTTWIVPVDNKRCLQNVIDRHQLNQTDMQIVFPCNSTEQALETILKQGEVSPYLESVKNDIQKYRNGRAYLQAIDILYEKLPQFFYTSHFERMSGEISLDQLNADKQKGEISPGDKIFLEFLEYAGTTLEELTNSPRYEDLVAQCEGASNDITDEIFEFWSQNDALAVKIEINEGRPEDKPPFNKGRVAKIRIENKHHRVTVPLSERSAGFVWFFSFLSQFKQLKKTTGDAIILLDEPGLTLHGKAQSDLLRYIEQRLLPEHQVIFTTHSPFMVPSQRLADVRVVEDVVDYRDARKPVVKGTKVSSDVLSVDKDTLFPLQAHLGYEITQTLFVGKHSLLVEGPSDVVYLQVMSQALQQRGRTQLDSRWTLCPTGGLDKVRSFASLFGGNHLNIAVFSDYGSGDKSKVEKLRQSQILQSERVLTAADFTGKQESDVEDLFHPEVYRQIVNQSYGLEGERSIATEQLGEISKSTDRLVKRVESIFKTMPADVPDFNHYTPAQWLMRNPSFFDSDNPEILATLDSFEKVFKVINGFIDS